MGVVSPFPSRVRRPFMPPIGLQAVFREVRTEDELRQALTPTSVAPITQTLANVGRRIVIAAPITLKAPIVIAPQMAGTVIESHGYLPITCAVDGIDAFDVRAPLVTLRGLLITSPAIDGVSGGLAFDRAVRISTGGSECRVIDVHGFGVDCLVEGAAGVDGCQVRHSTIGAGGNGTDRFGVIFDGTGWRIHGNSLQGAGTGVAVYGGTSSGSSSIVGNDCSGAGIATSAGAGSNTISANTNAGAVTAHATDDALGGNT